MSAKNRTGSSVRRARGPCHYGSEVGCKVSIRDRAAQDVVARAAGLEYGRGGHAYFSPRSSVDRDGNGIPGISTVGSSRSLAAIRSRSNEGVGLGLCRAGRRAEPVAVTQPRQSAASALRAFGLGRLVPELSTPPSCRSPPLIRWQHKFGAAAGPQMTHEPC